MVYISGLGTHGGKTGWGGGDRIGTRNEEFSSGSAQVMSSRQVNTGISRPAQEGWALLTILTLLFLGTPSHACLTEILLEKWLPNTVKQPNN